MDQERAHFILKALFALALILPIVSWFAGLQGGIGLFLSTQPDSVKVTAFFRLLGLYAFTLAGLQLAIGSWRNRLADYFDESFIIPFHMSLGRVAFLLILAHPLFYFLSEVMGGIAPSLFLLLPQFGAYGQPGLIAFGATGLYLFIIAVIAAMFRKKIGFPLWKRLHYLNYLAFAFVLVHSMLIGTDLKVNVVLQAQWLLMGLVGAGGFANRMFELKAEAEVEKHRKQMVAAVTEPQPEAKTETEAEATEQQPQTPSERRAADILTSSGASTPSEPAASEPETQQQTLAENEPSPSEPIQTGQEPKEEAPATQTPSSRDPANPDHWIPEPATEGPTEAPAAPSETEPQKEREAPTTPEAKQEEPKEETPEEDINEPKFEVIGGGGLRPPEKKEEPKPEGSLALFPGKEGERKQAKKPKPSFKNKPKQSPSKKGKSPSKGKGKRK